MTFAGGNVGIGVANPLVPLHMSATTTTTSGSNYGIVESYNINPSSTSSAVTNVGAHFAANYNSSSNLTGGIIGSE